MNIFLLLLLFGSILVIEGLPYFLFPGTVKRFYDQIRQSEETVLRVAGFLMMALGLSIVYLVRSKVCQ